MRRLQGFLGATPSVTPPDQYAYVNADTRAAPPAEVTPTADGVFTDTLQQAAGDAMDALNSVTQKLTDMGLEPWQIALIAIEVYAVA
ncbi:hypothetical protein BESB_022600 [Besnoitia besnoiti]|uniref:Uncharacterized protein n=1 Tax=Besnoitia besnoiti TaxID=94643 RepID=A0A2A9LZE5_BESBE|nr:hypothetical protein BESB_022600 [Besnoitia besnoiti]PFH31768.1 hypothetical protein BESB_022600 [Besnoitia besnoiti]